MCPLEYQPFLSQKDYLRVEEASREKHEYVAGRLFAMAGASLNHNKLIKNLVKLLDDECQSSGCDLFFNDVKLKIESLHTFYYPDVLITCESQPGDAVFITSPCVAIEVLSKSTELTDRREKLLAYRTIETLEQYILVNQMKVEVESYIKDAAGNWKVDSCDQSKIMVRIKEHTIQVNVSDLYRGVHI